MPRVACQKTKKVRINKNIDKVYNLILCLSFMDLRILSAYEAMKFEPIVPTAVMRIYSGSPMMNYGYGRLRDNPLYVRKFLYVFDDLHGYSGDEMDMESKLGPDENPDIIFMSREDARQVIEDFVFVKDKVECLVVHCKHGQGRSAAVAMGLNETFELGDDTFRMSKEFPNFNPGVYELVVEAGKNLLNKE